LHRRDAARAAQAVMQASRDADRSMLRTGKPGFAIVTDHIEKRIRDAEFVLSYRPSKPAITLRWISLVPE
jgi:hypothetical protein